MKNRSREYIRIYKNHFGKIPKDDMGRSYDIHHIDGDYTNNDISNLMALSIVEHYKIHRDQGDWGSAWAISKRLDIDPVEKSELTRQMNLSNAANGIHWSQVASEQGVHPFQNPDFQKKMSKISMDNGTHQGLQKWTCEKCGDSGKGLSNYTRYHGVNCGISESPSKGRIWVNNGSVSKMINKNELEQLKIEGWVAGRGSSELTPRRGNANGSRGRAVPYVRKTTRPYNKKEKK